MFTPFDLVIIFFLLIYVAVTLWLFRGIKKLRSRKNLITSPLFLPQISIVIAARNEEKNILQCINKCIAQDYPKDKFEIIVVNDRSEDSTRAITEKISSDNNNVRLINVEELAEEYKKSGKKHALKQGIENSNGEIIILTDADCLPAPGWIKGIVQYFTKDTGVVVGHSPIKGKGLINRLLQLDNLSIIAVGAGGIGGGYPILSVGRNFAYRRKVYDEIGGFDKIKDFSSGDDDLFIMLVKKYTKWKINFASYPESFVFTHPPKSLKEAITQRMRWASKGLNYSLLMTIVLIAVFLFNVILFVSLPLFLTNTIQSAILLWSFLIKLIVDFILIYQAGRLMSESYLIKYYPLAALFHIPYLIFFGLYGTFGNVKWRGDGN